MNIAKALKVKNRLIGELNHRQSLIATHNVRNSVNVAKVNAHALLQESFVLRHNITTLKGAIATASAPIAVKLVELAETKSFVAWLTALPIKESKELQGSYGSPSVEVEYVSQITEEARQDLLTKSKNLINSLQDEVDEFNARTQVDWEETSI